MSGNSRDTNAKDLDRNAQGTGERRGQALVREGVPREEITTSYQVDVRYHGQGLRLPIAVDLEDLEKKGLKAISDQFDAEHKRLFTFALDARARDRQPARRQCRARGTS